MFNRRNALLGWATWAIMRQWAHRKAGRALGRDESSPRRWLRRLGRTLIAVVAALGLVAVWRKLRGGEDEWATPEPLDAHRAPEDPSPLSSVPPDDDIPPAA